MNQDRLRELFQQYINAGENWGETEIVAAWETRVARRDLGEHAWLDKKAISRYGELGF